MFMKQILQLENNRQSSGTIETPHSGPAVAKIASAVFWSTKPVASPLAAVGESGNVDLDSLISFVSIIYRFFELSMGLLTWEL